MSFYAWLSPFYDQIFPVSAAQLQFVQARVQGKVLDVGAGTGTLMWALAPHVQHIDGLEHDRAMCQQAEQKLQPFPHAHCLQGDMRDLPAALDGPYQAVLCLGNTLVHLQDTAEMAHVLQAFHHRLAPDGRLLVQVVNYDQVDQGKMPTFPVVQRENLSFERRYQLEGLHLRFQATLSQNGEVLGTESTLLCPLTWTGLQPLLLDSGFFIEEVLGDYQGQPFGPGSPVLIVVARKGKGPSKSVR